jgi:hypothetical protein
MSQESTPDTSVVPPTAKQAYYCWFKVIPIPGMAVKTSADEPAVLTQDFDIMSTKRPPDLPSGKVSAGMGSWQMDKMSEGKFSSGLSIEYVVVPGPLKHAREWPYKSPGDQWIEGSLTHFLMHFNIV